MYLFGRDSRDWIEVMVDPRNVHDEYAEGNTLSSCR